MASLSDDQIHENVCHQQLDIEQVHDKTKRTSCAFTEDSDQTGQIPSLICLHCLHEENMSHDTGFPTMWYVRPAKAQTSLLIHTV